MYLPYSKCDLGKRCVIKTDDNYVFRKFTLLCAISNSKCVGATLYKEGGMTKERFVEFLEVNIFNKYKNHLIIFDNAGSHNNEYVHIDFICKNASKRLFMLRNLKRFGLNVEELISKSLKHVCFLQTCFKTLVNWNTSPPGGRPTA